MVLVVVCGVNVCLEMVVVVICVGVKEFILLLLDVELIVVVFEVVVDDECVMIVCDLFMMIVIELVDCIVVFEVFVLIIGESGVGKEVMVCYVYFKFKCVFKLFVFVNCVVIFENLLELEFFGYEKGVFIGVIVCCVGKFEEVDGGMFLFDEILEMDVWLQVKLLCVIQECEIDCVGGIKLVKVNICILVMFNWDLCKVVVDGIFCEDLFFCLNVVNLVLLLLCECLIDIIVLVDYFVKKYFVVNQVEEKLIFDVVCIQLLVCEWMGNVCELENVMYCVVLLVFGCEIGLDVICMLDGFVFIGFGFSVICYVVDVVGVVQCVVVGKMVVEVEQDFILDMLDYCLGNCIYVVNIFGILICILCNKLKFYVDQGVEILQFNQIIVGIFVV